MYLLSLDSPEGNPPAKSYDELIEEHRERRASAPVRVGRIVMVQGIPEDKDAYNPSGPFTLDGERYQWFRIESRDAQDAVAMLAKERKEVYEIVPDVPSLPLEDPFIAQVGDEFLVGGVEIHKDEHDWVIGYRTVFYKGRALDSLERYMEGPDGMKDIRVVPLTSGADAGRLQVFTRPHFPIHARMMGRIAVTTFANLDEFSCERLTPDYTEWMHGFFIETEWGGVNDAYDLGNNLTGALAHISKFDTEGKRHYAAAAFVFDRVSRQYSPIEIIAERRDFPEGPMKIMPENLNYPEMHDDLADVLFSSRLSPKDGSLATANMVTLTCGLSDARTGELDIPNPFARIIATYFPHTVPI